MSMNAFTARFACASTVALALLFAAEAQAQTPRYQPARPTVSPYLNLFRNNTGPLPNYYSLVRPQLQQQDFNQRQMTAQQQQNAAIGALQVESRQMGATTQTGKGSGFMRYQRQGFMTNGGGRFGGGR
jgi:hypothetical protein